MPEQIYKTENKTVEQNQTGTTPNEPYKQSEQEKKAEKLEKADQKNEVLAAAASSGDADVHNYLAQRAVAVQNQDEDAIKKIDKAIADRLNP